jgi:hypothetical protein
MKNKEEIIILALSMGVVMVPSLILGLVGLLLWGMFWVPTLVAIAIIWVIGYVSDTFSKQKVQVDLAKVKVQELQVRNQQSVETSCAFCKVRNMVPVRLNTRNTFECTKCKQTSLMVFQFTAAQITTPLALPQWGQKVNLPIQEPVVEVQDIPEVPEPEEVPDAPSLG